MFTVDELIDKLNNNYYKTDYVVRIRRKYNHDPRWTDTNELLLWDFSAGHYSWLNDWHEGEETVEVIGYIAVEDIYIW